MQRGIIGRGQSPLRRRISKPRVTLYWIAASPYLRPSRATCVRVWVGGSKDLLSILARRSVCVCVCVGGLWRSERSEWSQWPLCLLPGRKASRCCAKLLLLLLLLLLLAACCVRRAAFCRKRLLVSCQLVPSSDFVGCAHPIGNTGGGCDERRGRGAAWVRARALLLLRGGL